MPDNDCERWARHLLFNDYEVSTYGQVRSVDRIRVQSHPRNPSFTQTRVLKGKVLAQCPDSDGYMTVVLQRDRESFTCKVARLVLETFVGPCPPGHQACHFPDSNKKNNRRDNLMWGTAAENRRHQDIHGTSTRGENHWNALLTQSQVDYIRARASRGCKQRLLATEYSVSPQVINNIVHWKRWRPAHTEGATT